MPTYEYACRDCGDHTEVVQAFTDDSLTVCPSCGGRLRKVFGNIGIAFKGSGFYKNDSRSSTSSTSTGAGTAAGGEGSGASGGGESGSGESGGDAKPKPDKAATPSTPAAPSGSGAKPGAPSGSGGKTPGSGSGSSGSGDSKPAAAAS